MGTGRSTERLATPFFVGLFPDAPAAIARRRQADVARLEQRVVSAVGGDEGMGLDLAWWGLALTLGGTILMGIAGIVAA